MGGIRRLVPYIFAVVIAWAIALFVQGYYVDQRFTVSGTVEKISSGSAQ